MLAESQKSGHVWPAYAAAEACLESAWGESKLTQRTKDVFGLKCPSDWDGATIHMDTGEFLHGHDVTQDAAWPVFDTYSQCFAERMAVLKRLAPEYPDYAAALAATSGEEFIVNVSRTWSTDPARGQKVLEIYNAHFRS